jgi:hypothetical protein
VAHIPAKLYGGTERVVSWLTDELVFNGGKGMPTNTKRKLRFVLIINASPKEKYSKTARLWRHFEKSLKRQCPREHIDLRDCKIPFADGKFTRTPGKMEKLRQLVLDCDGMFIATPTYWYNVPAMLKAFIEQLSPDDVKLSRKQRKLALAVYSPEGGELGVFTAVVAPLNMMGFSLIGNGYAWCDGTEDDVWWKEEIEWMAGEFSEHAAQ